MSEPVLYDDALSNVGGEHIFKPVVTFGASTVSTSRGVKDLTVARPTSTTLTLTFPKTYAEITSFHVGSFAATGTSLVSWIITTNAIDTTGIVTLTAVASTGTATAPAAGDIAYITIGVSCQTLNDRYTGSTA